jgi:PAS domain S-box-containing protein
MSETEPPLIRLSPARERRPAPRRWPARYGFALAAIAVALFVRWLLDSQLGDSVTIASLFLAILAVAWYGGFGPAAAAAAFVGLFAMAAVFPQAASKSDDHPAGLVFYFLITFGMAALGAAMAAARRRADAAAERLRTTVASIGDAVLVTDAGGRVTSLNPVAEGLTGWNSADAAGRPLDEVFRIVNEQSRRVVESPVAKVLREGTIVGLANHTVLIARDGRETPIDDSAAPIRDASGKVRGVVLVFRDISERRRGETLRQRLAAIVESSSDAIVGESLDGTITIWNDAAERLYGYSVGEAVGKSFSMLLPDDRSHEQTLALQRLRDGKRVGSFETVRRRKDGTLIDVSVGYSPIRDADGRPIGAAVIARDISDRKRAERHRSARAAVLQVLAQARSLHDAVSQILPAFCDLLGWTVGTLWVVVTADAEEQFLSCLDVWQAPDSDCEPFVEATQQARFTRDSSLPGRVWTAEQPVWVRDVTVDEGFLRREAAAACGLHTGFACPIVVDAAVTGVIEFFSRELREPEPDLLESLSTIAGLIAQFLERQRAVNRLRESERELSDFFENASVGLQWVGADGTILRVNRAELELLGYTSEEYVGRHIAEFHVDQPVIEDILARLHRGEVLRDFPARMRRKDGSICDVLIDSSGLFQGDRFIHSRSFIRDVTQRKRSEETSRFLARASAELASLVDSASTLQKLAALSVPFFADWCVIDMQQPGGTLHRSAVAHVDPDKVQLARELHERFPPDPDAPRGAWQIIRTGQSEIIAEITDDLLEATVPNPEQRDMIRRLGLRSYIGVPIEARGKVLGAIIFISAESRRRYGEDDLAVAEDLAHRAGVAIENVQLYQQVCDADRRKDEFLAMLAHELRNPLAPIRSGLELLALHDDGQQETVQLMQEQVGHLVRLVDDLLDVSRIVRGKVVLRQQTVALHEAVKRSAEAAAPTVRERKQELTVDLSDEPLCVHADRVRLAQILDNLLSNASKYTDCGGRIELSVQPRDGRAVITVRDSGIGIEPELLPHVFELFTQSSRALDRAQGGLGIGLTLVRNLVGMHGGTVSARSEGTGMGSEFTVTFPIAEAVDNAAPPEELPETDGTPRRVLVVDDNVGAARLLSLLIDRLGRHQVEIAHDGPAALRRLEEFEPDVVLLDIGLPGMDGYEVGRAIRANPEFQHVLLAAVTGYGQVEDQRRSREAGFDEHLVKPMSVDTLLALLAHPKLRRNAGGQ